eukprot:CAMPEP_0203983924 /NCGR_PEP_ID=MMETSP0360-20130528/4145_1 /ASSEMBLY_ACC=CAM_ASM_000342 /TAXON_ID=268821 /ORGANISM="Scrippsiella Hangoei, Strain SHTV-5" /LENGTH=160 /DNA_ID=CAMNT_0050922889 /DNA_START=30 /DNA_END=512 /DNA_ORIENTATION=+
MKNNGTPITPPRRSSAHQALREFESLLQGCQPNFHVLDLRDLSKVETDLAVVSLLHLRLRDEADGHVVPLLVEGCACILHQAHAKEAVHGLRRSGEDADISQHATEQDALDAQRPQLFLQGSRGEGTEGPLVDDDLAGQRGALRVELVAHIACTDQVVAH